MSKKLIYHPEGVDPQEWELEPMKLLSPECMVIEKLTGVTFYEWIDEFSRGSMQAVHAALYVLLKRKDPTLKPDEVVFSFSDITLVRDDDEDDDEDDEQPAAVDADADDPKGTSATPPDEPITSGTSLPS